MKDSVFYQMSVLTLSGTLLNLLGFGYRMFLAHTVGAEGIGVYQLVLPFYSVLQAATLSGLCLAVSAIAAREGAFGAKRVFFRAAGMFFALFCAVFTITLTQSDFLSRVLLGDTRTRKAILLLLPCLFLTGFENLWKHYFYGIQKSRPPITSELTEQLVRYLAVAVLLLTIKPTTSENACACIVLGMVISEVVSVCILARFFRKERADFSPMRTTRKDLLAIALPAMASGLLLNLLSSLNAVLIPRRLIFYGYSAARATREYGILFGMTLPLLTLPLALLGALPAVLIPKLSEGLNVPALTRRKAAKALHLTGLLAFPALALSLPLGNALLQAFYKQTVPVQDLLPLCLATFFSFYQFTSAAILNGIGKTRSGSVHALASGAVQFCFTWLTGAFGLRAFLWGNVLSTLLCMLWNLCTVQTALHLRFRFRNWVVTPALAALLAGLMTHTVFLRFCADRVPLATLFSALLGCALYLLALRIQGTSLSRYLKPILRQKSQIQTPRKRPEQA